MLVIPAIDLKDGRCVRLRQGDMTAETVYSGDVPAVARQWQQGGATLIHVVDLNGAVEGEPRNLSQIEEIIRTVTVKVQVGRDSVDRDCAALSRRWREQGCTWHCGIDRSVFLREGLSGISSSDSVGTGCAGWEGGGQGLDCGIGNDGDGHAQGVGRLCLGRRDLYGHCP